jgi:hypothetical protein
MSREVNDKEINRMKKYAAFAASVAISAAALVGCGGEDDFCNQAEDFGSSGEMPDSGEIADFVDSAPDEIKADVQTLVDAAQDPTSADEGAITEASTNLEEWGNENCDT